MLNSPTVHQIVSHILYAIQLGEKILNTEGGERATAYVHALNLGEMRVIDFTLQEVDLAERFQQKYHLPHPASQVPDNQDFEHLHRLLFVLKALYILRLERQEPNEFQKELSYIRFGLLVWMISIVTAYNFLAAVDYDRKCAHFETQLEIAQHVQHANIATANLLVDLNPLRELYDRLHAKLGTLVDALKAGRHVTNPGGHLFALLDVVEKAKGEVWKEEAVLCQDIKLVSKNSNTDLQPALPEELLNRIARMMLLHMQGPVLFHRAQAKIGEISFNPPEQFSHVRWTIYRDEKAFKVLQKAANRLKELYLMPVPPKDQVRVLQQIVIAYALKCFGSTSPAVKFLSPKEPDPMQLARPQSTVTLPRAAMPTFYMDLNVIKGLVEETAKDARSLGTVDLASQLSELCALIVLHSVSIARNSSYTIQRAEDFRQFLEAFGDLTRFLGKHEDDIKSYLESVPQAGKKSKWPF